MAQTNWHEGVGPPDLNFTNAANWDNDVPAPGGTIGIRADGTAPTSNRPTTATDTYNFVCEIACAPGAWLNGAKVGAITVNTLVTAPAAWFGLASVLTGAIFEIGETVVAGNVELVGGTLDHSGVLDGGVSGTGGTVDWRTGGSVIGSFNVSGPVTHLNANYCTLDLTDTGTLNLGGIATGLAVHLHTGTTTYNATDSGCATFTQDGGALVNATGTAVLNVAGAINISGGDNTGFLGTIKQTASGNVRIGYGNQIGGTTHLASAAGVTSTLATEFTFTKLKTGLGTVTPGALDLYAINSVNDFLDLDPLTIWTGNTCILTAFVSANINQKAFKADVGLILRSSNGNRTITATGDWDVGSRSFQYYSPHVSQMFTINMNGHRLRCGLIMPGTEYIYNIVLNLSGGSHKIGGLTKIGTSTAVVNFGSSYVECSGNVDGTGIAFTNVAARLIAVGGTRTITGVHVPAGEKLHLHGAWTDGGGNENIDINTEAPPGNLAMMGVGV